MLSDTLKKNIIFINSARVIACFFIAQERAQYRAEAHDMEVSEMEMKQVYEALEKLRTVLTTLCSYSCVSALLTHMLFPIVSIQQLHDET